jgi:hypothetical protein
MRPLFLTPPTPVMVNTCFYIDGGMQGATEQALERDLRHAWLSAP